MATVKNAAERKSRFAIEAGLPAPPRLPGPPRPTLALCSPPTGICRRLTLYVNSLKTSRGAPAGQQGAWGRGQRFTGLPEDWRLEVCLVLLPILPAGTGDSLVLAWS